MFVDLPLTYGVVVPQILMCTPTGLQSPTRSLAGLRPEACMQLAAM